jgi:CheY-like chemotaxis protein
MATREKDIDLLYIEDNEDYLDFVGMAVRKVDRNLNFKTFSDPLKAKDLLEDKKQHNPMRNAKVVMLDFYMPGVNGIQLLKKIRSYPEMKHTPVIIFSTSDNPEDIREAYSNGANAYLLKPTGMQNLNQTMQLVCDFWLHKNKPVASA